MDLNSLEFNKKICFDLFSNGYIRLTNIIFYVYKAIDVTYRLSIFFSLYNFLKYLKNKLFSLY